MKRLPFFFFGVCSVSVLPIAASQGTRPSNLTPTFARDVAPILFDHCASCHRPGEVAPFSLLTYQDAKKRARLIAEVTQQKLMPPWKPQQGYGGFVGQRHLSAGQIAVLRRWVEHGASFGKRADLPSAPKFTPGWQLGQPDMILSMPRAFTIPAEGADVNRSFVLPVTLPRDKYVRAAEFRPGNRRVVHHATVLIDTSGKARQIETQSGEAGGGFRGGMGFGKTDFMPSGSLGGGYVPGMMSNPNPPDAPNVLPKKADIVFGMHYHPTGKVESDRSSIGLYFTDKPPRRVGSVILMGVLNLEIQPGEMAHPEHATFTLPVDVEVQSIAPHMHLIGKSVKMWAELPDGSTRPLIKINDWDFNWQGTYQYARPFRLPKGAKIHGDWTHDNSANNPRNPISPPRRVRNGENSTDEMAAAWIPVLVDTPGDNGALWVANLGHLARAAFSPPALAAPYQSRATFSNPAPSLGLSALKWGSSGVEFWLSRVIRAPLPTIIISLFAVIALAVIPLWLCPHFSARTAHKLQKPGRCFMGGLVAFLIFLCVAVPLLFAAPIFAQSSGALLALLFGFCLLLGMSGVMQGALKNWRYSHVAFWIWLAKSLASAAIVMVAFIILGARGAGLMMALLSLCALGAGSSVFSEEIKTRGQTYRKARRAPRSAETHKAQETVEFPLTNF